LDEVWYSGRCAERKRDRERERGGRGGKENRAAEESEKVSGDGRKGGKNAITTLAARNSSGMVISRVVNRRRAS